MKMKDITYIKAIQEAVDEEMERDPTVFAMGEDMVAWGAPLGEFGDLPKKWGRERMRGTPISETAIVGSAIGAAATGMRPIANIMFTSFYGVCGDELMNQIQMRYMFGGKVKLPLTIMSYCGAGLNAAHQHSKNLFGWLLSFKGLKIAIPSTPYDAKGLLKSAIRDDDPVAYLYHWALLGTFGPTGVKGKIPVEEYVIPLGVADIKREGSDVTVVATSMMVHRALAAADKLQEKGISVEVIDPRTLVPLDKKTILDSVKKTHKLVLIDEDPKTGSAAGEIAAIVAEEAFEHLKAPIRRVCAIDTPVPFSPPLEKFWLPDEEKLIKAVTEICS
ncbi:alpha-ketoacid dehydrogenase subunit beta [Chloroflexota bacterium]